MHGNLIGTIQLARREVVSRPVRLAPRPAFLAGREDLLRELDERLAAAGSWPRVVALCGLGGAGKTSVAVEYAYRHLAGLGVVWQFPAEEPAALAAGFGDLAGVLGVGDALGGGDPVAAVHGALAALIGEWLLVFDNATSPADVRGFLPPVGNGRVLITTRDAIWSGGKTLDVPVLDNDAAAGFLVTRTGQAGQQDTARELAAELGELPLALEQAAAYMHAAGLAMTAYLGLFKERSADLLARGGAAGYDERVATTWALAFSQIERTSPVAAGLLRLLASCAPESVPLDLMLQPRPGLAGDFGPDVGPVLAPLLEDSLAVSDAVAALRSLSLVSAPAGGAVSVHRLVQGVTNARRPGTAAAWKQAAATLIEAALPAADITEPKTWPAYRALLPHALIALTFHSDGMGRIASYLGHSGDYAAARDRWRQVQAARDEALGTEHRKTLTARGHVALWTGRAGDPAGARDAFAALLPDIERVLGPKDQDSLIARANLARWTGAAGDPARARDQLAALLPDFMQQLGPDHPQSLTARASLARWTGRAGDPAGARDLYAALLPDRERVSGAEHTKTLNARAGLAYWTGHAGDPAAARDQVRALLTARDQVFDPEHPDTLNARASLAHWTGDAGDPAGARDQYAALLLVRERRLGPEHPQTLGDRANLARWTGEAGNPAGARDQYAALLPACERVLGAEHPDTLTARHQLACWTGQAKALPPQGTDNR